jgi:diguanylate cyclase (GGDEF)-like protein
MEPDRLGRSGREPLLVPTLSLERLFRATKVSRLAVLAAFGAVPLAHLAAKVGHRRGMKPRTEPFAVSGAIGATLIVSYLKLWLADVRDLERATIHLSRIGSSTDVYEVTNAVAALIAETLHAEKVGVYLREWSHTGPDARFHLAGSYGGPPIQTTTTTYTLEGNESEQRLFRLTDSADPSLFKRPPVFALPLFADGHVFGMAEIGGIRSSAGTNLVPAIQRSATNWIASIVALSAFRDVASTDVLTGLWNRRQFETELVTLEPGDAVALLDLDHFKAVNDTHGHLTGDGVIRAFGEMLNRVAGRQDCAARFGGEEFVLLVRGSNHWRARALVEGLVRDWAASDPLTTFSAGIAEHEGGRGEATVDAADRALYASKEGGRNRITVARSNG